MAPTVTIGIPTGEYFTVCRDFYVSITKLINYSYRKKIVSDIQLIHTASPKTADNRNEIFEQSTCDYVFQVDADMTFKPDTLQRMLITARGNENAVISGWAHMGSPPYYPALFVDGETIKPISHKPDSPFEINLVGSFGFLTPRKIVTSLGKGWFDHVIETNEKTGESREVRHDFAFCRRVRENGFKIVCNPAIDFLHIRPRHIGYQDWETNRDANS